jgi:hypothetical protein
MGYQSFWKHVVNLTEGRTRPLTDEVSFRRDGDGIRVKTENPIIIREAPARQRGSKRRSFDIELNFNHFIQEGPENRLEIRKSNVQVHYKETRKGVSCGFHFDLDLNRHHPIFHVQLDDREHGRFDAPRIPTAPIDLCGAIYMILHDHFSSKVRGGWPEAIKVAVNALPRLPTRVFRAPAGQQMSCTQWYPHPEDWTL